MKVPENNQYVLFGGSFVLANKMQLVADRTVTGLSTKQWFLLRSLFDMPEEPAPTITSLAKETDTSRQNVTKMLEVLQRQGCVTLGDNPHDHRSRTIEMTDHGLRLLGTMAKQSEGFFKDLFSGISDEQCAVAAQVAIKMIENLSRMQEDLV
ncbi:MarR family winged helix-turn-helix transcriptional regulator [Ruminococcaceae bacterium OttesenSCG-928-L11]|nr:MarR family winged helix-turn-helix transcriptional regulator [Ruminococcaceae bacterium OttesenSCG-928-L11]